LLQFNDEQLKITDKTKFNNWLNSPKLKHTNKLDYQDKYVQRIIEKFHNVDAFKIYNFLRIYYWQHCETYNDFENEIKEKIENINNIGELL
jgi:hypothetical protein